MRDHLPLIGAAITCALGLLGIFFPQRVARVLGLQPTSILGVSEVRATYGGFFFFIGLSCIIFANEHYFFIAGGAWASAAFLRLISTHVDKSTSLKNLGGIMFEATVAFLLFSGSRFPL